MASVAERSEDVPGFLTKRLLVGLSEDQFRSVTFLSNPPFVYVYVKSISN